MDLSHKFLDAALVEGVFPGVEGDDNLILDQQVADFWEKARADSKGPAPIPVQLMHATQQAICGTLRGLGSISLMPQETLLMADAIWNKTESVLGMMERGYANDKSNEGQTPLPVQIVEETAHLVCGTLRALANASVLPPEATVVADQIWDKSKDFLSMAEHGYAHIRSEESDLKRTPSIPIQLMKGTRHAVCATIRSLAHLPGLEHPATLVADTFWNRWEGFFDMVDKGYMGSHKERSVNPSHLQREVRNKLLPIFYEIMDEYWWEYAKEKTSSPVLAEHNGKNLWAKRLTKAWIHLGHLIKDRGRGVSYWPEYLDMQLAYKFATGDLSQEDYNKAQEATHTPAQVNHIDVWSHNRSAAWVVLALGFTAIHGYVFAGLTGLAVKCGITSSIASKTAKGYDHRDRLTGVNFFPVIGATATLMEMTRNGMPQVAREILAMTSERLPRWFGHLLKKHTGDSTGVENFAAGLNRNLGENTALLAVFIFWPIYPELFESASRFAEKNQVSKKIDQTEENVSNLWQKSKNLKDQILGKIDILNKDLKETATQAEPLSKKFF